MNLAHQKFFGRANAMTIKKERPDRVGALWDTVVKISVTR